MDGYIKKEKEKCILFVNGIFVILYVFLCDGKSQVPITSCFFTTFILK